MSDLARGGVLEALLQRLESLEEKVDAIRATLSQSPPSRAPASELRPRPEVLAYSSAAQALDVSVSTLKRMIAKGQIANCDVGDGKGIPRSEIVRIASGERMDSTKRRSARPPRAHAPRGSTERERIREALRDAKHQG